MTNSKPNHYRAVKKMAKALHEYIHGNVSDVPLNELLAQDTSGKVFACVYKWHTSKYDRNWLRVVCETQPHTPTRDELMGTLIGVANGYTPESDEEQGSIPEAQI